jgi:hypothetical protein
MKKSELQRLLAEIPGDPDVWLDIPNAGELFNLVAVENDHPKTVILLWE